MSQSSRYITKQEIKNINIMAIMAIFLFSGAGSFMNAAIQTIADAWPQLSISTVRLVTSLPSLISIPVTILTGAVAGKKLSYRFCAICGTGLILVCGAAPVWLHMSWGLVLFFRAMVGVGVGLVAMRNSLILDSVPDEKQASVIGWGAALMNAGAILAGPLVGVWVVYGWNYAFLYDLLAFFPLLFMIFFLKEPASADLDSAATVLSGSDSAGSDSTAQSYPGASANFDSIAASSTASKWNWRLTYYIVVQFLMTAALYPLLSGMSTYMAYHQIGSAVTAGFSNSTYNVLGVLACIIISPLERKLGKNFLSVMSILFAVGMGLIVFFPRLPTILLGAGLCGITFNGMMAIYQFYNGKAAPARAAAFSSTMIIAALSLGNFASVYYINLCDFLFHRGCDIDSTYFGSMILYLVLALIAFLVKPAPREYYTKVN